MSCDICEGNNRIEEKWWEGHHIEVYLFGGGELVIELFVADEHPEWVGEIFGELSVCKEINYCPKCGEKLGEEFVDNWGGSNYI